MNVHFCSGLLLCANAAGFSTWVLPVIAIIIAGLSFWKSTSYSGKNLRISVRQAIFKTVGEKAKDCNAAWEKENMVPVAGPQNKPYFSTVSEVIISMEVIGKSLDLFKREYKAVMDNEDDYYWLFWKQLRTDLRGFLRTNAPDIAATMRNDYYTQQVNDIHKRFGKHFEPVK
jgi:hypothetical protein